MSKPRTHWPQPDFVRAQGAAGLLEWSLVLVGGVLLLLAGAQAWAAHDDWLQAQAQRARANQMLAQARQRTQSAVPANRPNPSAAGSATAVKTARALLGGLHPAWGELLQTLEGAVAHKVTWLALDRDAERGDLRLEGVAPHIQAVVATVLALVNQPGWHNVELKRLVQGSDGGLRFEITAQLEPI